MWHICCLTRWHLCSVHPFVIVFATGVGVSVLVVFVGVACLSFNPLAFTCYCCIRCHGGVSVFIVFVGVVLVLVWHVCHLIWCSPIHCCIWHWVGVNGFVVFVGIVLMLMWHVNCLTHWHWCRCLPVCCQTTAAAVVWSPLAITWLARACHYEYNYTIDS